MFQVGQALIGRITFANGNKSKYPRPHLIVEVTPSNIGVLDVSSTSGKEHKLLFDSNYSLDSYEPPFNRPSFVKLDSYRVISIVQAQKLRIAYDGKKLNSNDLQKILTMYISYK